MTVPRARHPHACRADLAGEADRALDPLRPRCRRADPRSPPAHPELRAQQRLRLCPLGGERLRHRRLAHRHPARCRSRRSLLDRRLCAPRRRNPLAPLRLAKVERVLQAIDAVEQLGIDPADACPDHWRHVQNRLASGDAPRPYTRERHRAWLLRRRIEA